MRPFEGVAPTAVFLDDFESFLPTRAQLCARSPRPRDGARADGAHLHAAAPPEMLADFKTIQLAPAAEHIAPADAEPPGRRGAARCASWAPRAATWRAARAVEWLRLPGTALDDGMSTPMAPFANNCRDALLTRKCGVADWVRATERRDADLLREHVPRLGDGAHSVAHAMDALSLAEVLAPDRYEFVGAQDAMRRHVAGEARGRRARATWALAPSRTGATPAAKPPSAMPVSTRLDLPPALGVDAVVKARARRAGPRRAPRRRRRSPTWLRRGPDDARRA